MNKKIINVAIIGITGYGGLELLRLLYNHPAVHVVSIHNTSDHAEEISTTYPHLKSMYNLTPIPVDPLHIMQSADVVFFSSTLR